MNRICRTLMATVLFFATVTIQTPFAQTKSAIQFYDSTGATKTGKVGWAGDASNGHLFLQTPSGGEVLKATSGGVEVTGAMNATRFSGDGSGLTNLPSPVVSAGSVSGLQDSLNRRSDTNWVKSRLGIKADTGWVTTKIAGIGTAQIPDGSVTTVKIADTAVTAGKIRDKAVTDAKIDSVNWTKVKNKPLRYRTHSDSVTWAAGTDGQVWKMGANGTPGWGADLQGAGGATTISGITGLADSLTAHRTLINAKADASHSQPISTVTGLTDSITAHRTLINGKANTSHTQAISTVTGLSDSITAHRTLISGKANTTHGHGISDVTGLQTALDGKAGTANPWLTGDVKIGSGGSFVVFPDSTKFGIIDHKRAITIKDGRISAGITMELVSGESNGAGSDFHFMAGGDAPATNYNFYANGSGDRQGDAVLRIHGKESGGWSHAMEISHDGTQGVIHTLSGDINMTPATGVLKVNGVQVATSDKRFKKNIQPIESCLEKVSKLEGVHYEFRNGEFPDKKFPAGKQVGLIAQDVEKVVPEVVVTDDKGYKSLAYDRLVAVLIGAIKEQQQEIESLKKVVDQMKAQ